MSDSKHKFQLDRINTAKMCQIFPFRPPERVMLKPKRKLNKNDSLFLESLLLKWWVGYFSYRAIKNGYYTELEKDDLSGEAYIWFREYILRFDKTKTGKISRPCKYGKTTGKTLEWYFMVFLMKNFNLEIKKHRYFIESVYEKWNQKPQDFSIRDFVSLKMESIVDRVIDFNNNVHKRPLGKNVILLSTPYSLMESSRIFLIKKTDSWYKEIEISLSEELFNFLTKNNVSGILQIRTLAANSESLPDNLRNEINLIIESYECCLDEYVSNKSKNLRNLKIEKLKIKKSKIELKKAKMRNLEFKKAMLRVKKLKLKKMKLEKLRLKKLKLINSKLEKLKIKKSKLEGLKLEKIKMEEKKINKRIPVKELRAEVIRLARTRYFDLGLIPLRDALKSNHVISVNCARLWRWLKNGQDKPLFENNMTEQA